MESQTYNLVSRLALSYNQLDLSTSGVFPPPETERDNSAGGQFGANAMDSTRVWHIYTLSDPRTLAVRYVGWTLDTANRLYNHIYTAKRGGHYHVSCWIRQLLTLNMQPVMTVVETGVGDWEAAERRWIARYRAKGADLTNGTDGGEGTTGYRHSDSAKQKVSVANKKHKHTKEWLDKISKALRELPPEVRKRIADGRRGHPLSDEHKRHLSERRMGFRWGHHSEETKRRMSESAKRAWARKRTEKLV